MFSSGFEISNWHRGSSGRSSLIYAFIYNCLNKLITDVISSGEALDKMRQMIIYQKGDSKVKVFDYINTNQDIEIELNPLLDPSQNLKARYKRVKVVSSNLTAF